MDTAGHQIVARAFGRRTRQHRRFDFIKRQLVESLTDFENHFVAQRDIPLQPRTPQIQIAVFETQFLVGVHVIFNLEWRSLGGIQNVKTRHANFNFAAGQIGISLLPAGHAAFHRDHKFRTQFRSFGVSVRAVFLREHKLRQSRTVAQIHKNKMAKIAPPVHPTHQHDVAPFIGSTQLAGRMRPV